MTQLIQIAPGVLFSSDVLSPEWGRTRRRDERVVETITSGSTAESPRRAVPEEHDCNPSEASGDQLSLL